MGDLFHAVDLAVFLIALVAVMAVGLLAGRGETESSEQYFLAGRHIRWWGVAGSIYGSNVSANHLVGMLGLGFSIGFAQSHFELGAIFGLLMLCYGFLPVYRRLKIYTLSEYLGRRYDDRSRLSYAVIMVLIMAGVQMVPGLYIGARSACVMVGNAAIENHMDPVETVGDRQEIESGQITRDDLPLKPVVRVDRKWYAAFVLILAVISTVYTVLGGLRAVVLTDAIQSLLLLGGGLVPPPPLAPPRPHRPPPPPRAPLPAQTGRCRRSRGKCPSRGEPSPSAQASRGRRSRACCTALRQRRRRLSGSPRPAWASRPSSGPLRSG